jgi:hypothetical protein
MERTDMEVLIREQRTHLSHNILNKIFSFLFCDIHGNTIPHRPSQLTVIMFSEPIVTVCNEFRIRLTNSSSVSRSIKLRNNTNTTRVSIGNQMRNSLRRIGSHGVIGCLLLKICLTKLKKR